MGWLAFDPWSMVLIKAAVLFLADDVSQNQQLTTNHFYPLFPGMQKELSLD